MSALNPYLEFHFSSGESPTLSRTVFYAPSNGEPLIGVRSCALAHPIMPFKWTPTTQAVAILVVKAALLPFAKDKTYPLLEGRNGTPAYNIGKLIRLKANPWLLDLFGSDKQGTSLFQRVFICCNYKLSCASPIQVFLRESFLPASSIRVFLDGTNISGQRLKLQRLCLDLEKSWKPGNNGSKADTKRAPHISQRPIGRVAVSTSVDCH